jgi:hypothetical protein
MIIRNSVVLIHQIEMEKVHGRRPWEAVIEASAHRFRPILLTATAAILGMVPSRADRLLGSDGLGDHGQTGGRDIAGPDLPAGALRDLAADQETSAGLDPEDRSSADRYSSAPDVKRTYVA